ncbi:MAG: hypothetical protein ACM3IH_19855 [Sphingobacteriales bacterium]
MTQIHEFTRRDGGLPRRERRQDSTDADPPAENLNSLIRRVGGASMDEIDAVILELKRVRDTLDTERERLIRDITRYASLNHSLMIAMKIISEKLKQSEGTPSREQSMADFKARWLGGSLAD